MISIVNIDYKKTMKDIYDGIVTGLAVACIVINLQLPEKVMGFVRDIKTSNQAQEMLKMLDDQKVGHINADELGWNCEAC